MVSTIKKFVFFIALATGSGFLGAAAYLAVYEKSSIALKMQEGTPSQFASYKGDAPETSVDFIKAAEMTVHCVVNVKTYFNKQISNGFDPFRDFFYGQRQQPEYRQAEASGSGVIITDDGYIVTNYHVIENAEKIEITLNDKRNLTAKLIGSDPTTDLALLKIEGTGYPSVIYGNSDDLKVGEWVLAVGNPFNLTSTVTAGIVSAKARDINILSSQFKIESYIQTDAAVNPGNSGGALVNTRGELIGINSAIASNTGSYAGYSFAVPVNIVKKVANDLLEYGSVQRAFIGVNIREVDAKLASEKNLKNIKGVYVEGITPGGAAADAGIQAGDIITRVAGNAVNTSPELQEQVGKYRPGDKIEVVIVRDDVEKVLKMELKNKEGNTEIIKKDKNAIISILGAEFETLSAEELRKLNIPAGVKISRLIGGKLRSAGIREGFIITSIDKKEIRDTDDLVFMLKNKKGGVLIEGVYPNGMRAFYGFGI